MELLKLAVLSGPALLMPILILLGLRFGIATPTEISVLAVVYALALSARSDVYTEFDGGPGQVAIHGRDLLGGTLGDAQSHGCVRLASASITWLAYRIRPGVPVTIETR